MTSSFIVTLGLMLLLATCHQPAFACDNDFLFEPSYREPDDEYPDTFAGFLISTWRNDVTGTTIVTFRVLKDPTTNPEGEAEPFPLFYFITRKNHTSLRYIDPVGNMQCTDIKRY